MYAVVQTFATIRIASADIPPFLKALHLTLSTNTTCECTIRDRIDALFEQRLLEYAQTRPGPLQDAYSSRQRASAATKLREEEKKAAGALAAMKIEREQERFEAERVNQREQRQFELERLKLENRQKELEADALPYQAQTCMGIAIRMAFTNEGDAAELVKLYNDRNAGGCKEEDQRSTHQYTMNSYDHHPWESRNVQLKRRFGRFDRSNALTESSS